MTWSFASALAVACGSPPSQPAAGDRWWDDVKQLASDDLEGRQTGSEGYRKAVQYVVDEFREVGAEPAGTDGFRQPVQFEARNLVEERSKVEIARGAGMIPMEFGVQTIVLPVGSSGEPLEAELVFVGYGLSIPEYGHDDFAGLDVRGKIVVTLQGAPSAVPGTVAAHYSSFDVRVANLKRQGAVGSLLILNPRLEEIPWARLAATRSQSSNVMDLADRDLAVFANAGQIAGMVNPEHAAVVLGVDQARFDEILQLDREKKPLPTFPIAGRLRATITFDRSTTTSENVVARIQGSDAALRSEYVLLSAHLDHVGVREAVNGDSIYNGAMDNASGVATLLEVARRLKDTGQTTRRSILLLPCTGEEEGLLGSKYFAARPTVPIGSIVANINLDMFLPLVPLKIVRGYGIGESDLAAHLQTAAKAMGIAVQDDPQPERNIFIRSDQYSFIKRGVPALFLGVGSTPGSDDDKTMGVWFQNRYHAPSDDLAQPVDFAAAAGFNDLMTRLTVAIANADQKPRWNDDSFFRTFAAPN
jgi:Zn-dependent M28 family amino/carboxypeptidase